MFRIQGIQDLEQEITKLKEKLEGTHIIPMNELLSPEFMIRFTNFSSIEELIEASGYVVESEIDFEQIPDDEWDLVISANTQFLCWKDMLDFAASEYIQSNLNFGKY